MKQQKGFNVVGLVVVITVVGIVGLIGFYVWQKTRPIEVKETAASATPAVQTATVTAPKSKVPEGYVLYESTNPKFSFAYPKEWDAHKDAQMIKGVKVAVYEVDKNIPGGIYPDIFIKYNSKTKNWEQYAGTERQSDVPQPQILWKDSNKTVYNLSVGEGGAYRERVAFIIGNKVVFITGPNLNGGEFTTYDDGYKLSSDSFSEKIAESISF